MMYPMAPRAEREGRVIDLAKPVTLSAYGFWTKRAGFHELAGATLKPLVYEDASFSTPVRAVLELRGGESARRGIRRGARVTHPAFTGR